MNAIKQKGIDLFFEKNIYINFRISKKNINGLKAFQTFGLIYYWTFLIELTE